MTNMELSDNAQKYIMAVYTNEDYNDSKRGLFDIIFDVSITSIMLIVVKVVT